jgi:hypothetical protein
LIPRSLLNHVEDRTLDFSRSLLSSVSINSFFKVILTQSAKYWTAISDLVNRSQTGLTEAPLNVHTEERILDQIRFISDDHETAGYLQDLVVFDGAGNWPPQTNHGNSWPEPLRPYHEIYLQLVPTLSCATVLPNDLSNYRRCQDYRARMRMLLQGRIVIADVATLLSDMEAGSCVGFDLKAYNGFYACIALSRHAFR